MKKEKAVWLRIVRRRNFWLGLSIWTMFLVPFILSFLNGGVTMWLMGAGIWKGFPVVIPIVILLTFFILKKTKVIYDDKKESLKIKKLSFKIIIILSVLLFYFLYMSPINILGITINSWMPF